MRDGHTIVQLCFPAYAVANLADLVPDEARPMLSRQGIDLEQLAATAAARGCPPGELLAVPGGDLVVRAWLE